MKLIFNGRFIDDTQIGLNDLYRAVFFGDGLFESIYADNESIYLADAHLNRLKKGAAFLKLPFPPGLDAEVLAKQIREIISINGLSPAYRIKILLWRSGKGTYRPETIEKSDYLILIEPSEVFSVREISGISISENVKLPSGDYAEFKRISALDYVIAAIEKSEQNAGELLLTDSTGNVSEGISSNVIIVDANRKIFVTPGGNSKVRSSMSPYVLKGLLENHREFKHEINTQFHPDELRNATCIIFVNSFNIRVLKNTNDFHIPEAEEILARLPKQPLRP